MAKYAQVFPHGYYGHDAVAWWYGPRLTAFIEENVGATLMELSTAFFVEISSRTWLRLRDERLVLEGATQ